jgi:hypothetical protein
VSDIIEKDVVFAIKIFGGKVCFRDRGRGKSTKKPKTENRA